MSLWEKLTYVGAEARKKKRIEREVKRLISPLSELDGEVWENIPPEQKREIINKKIAALNDRLVVINRDEKAYDFEQAKSEITNRIKTLEKELFSLFPNS